jgi:4-hydroxybenzoate polyprenyltransferase
MTKNMGAIDRGVRLAVSAILVVLAFGSALGSNPVLFWLALAVAAIFTMTSLVSFCPLYRIVGLKTCREN